MGRIYEGVPMNMRDILTTAVNRRGKFFRLEDESVLHFKTMLDIDGNVTTDPDQCILAVYQLPNGLMRGVDLRLFDDDMQEVTH